MAPGAAASPYNQAASGRSAAPDRRPSDEPALAAARRQRAELLQSIHEFERALAVPPETPAGTSGSWPAWPRCATR